MNQATSPAPAVENEDSLSAPLTFTHIAGQPAAPGEAENLSRPHEIIFAPDNQHFALPIQGRAAGMGIDMLQIYRYQRGEIIKTDEVKLATGSWPRHVDFHPTGRWLYCLTELANTLNVFDYNAAQGKITLKQTLSSLPDGWRPRSDASEVEVHRDGHFLYAANRGHDSIGIFRINQQDGTLTATEWVHCGGKTPRFTTFSPMASISTAQTKSPIRYASLALTPCPACCGRRGKRSGGKPNLYLLCITHHRSDGSLRQTFAPR